MINILSYLGMNIQSEVCLWTLLGLMRTIFDATLFKVNANLKQVWQMTMPMELTMPVQRVLRTMISGVMLVQCFTVYVYLASYIVLLYPVFLEERPTLVLPWLLLAAIRKLLCELTSLALGLGTCVLLGPAKPPCIKFVIFKVASIMPAFYMWMLVFSYYHALKVASSFKTFPAVLPSSDHDYGLELAVRRRRTKSLLDEEQLRKKLVANYYGERTLNVSGETTSSRPKLEISSRMAHATDMSLEDFHTDIDILQPMSANMTESYEDWSGSEITIPRDTDRILEQFVLMLLRIGAYLKTGGLDNIQSQMLSTSVEGNWGKFENDGPVMPTEDTETPPLVGSQGNTASYLLEYPQIFNRKLNPELPPSDRKSSNLKTVHSQIERADSGTIKPHKRVVSSDEAVSLDNAKKKTPDKNTTPKILHIGSETSMQEKTEQTSECKGGNGNIEDIGTREEFVISENTQSQTDIDKKQQSKDSLSTIMGSMKNHSTESKNVPRDRNKNPNGPSTSRTRSVRQNKTTKTDSSGKLKSDKSRKGNS